MRLSISNIGWDSENDKKVYELMKKHGYSGLEIAPTRIFPQDPYECIQKAKEWRERLKSEYGFSVPSMQSIWYGRNEKIFGSCEDREMLKIYTKKAIDFACVIGCKNLVFGCPRNRNVEENMSTLCAVDFFRELGEYAYEKGTTIGMEANPTIYNTNYVNDTLSALALINEVSSKGFLLNLDMGTVIQNGEDISEIVGKVNLINHIHISEPGLKQIQKREIHKKLKDILTNENYQGFVSIEMGRTDDLSVIEDTLRYIEEIFK